MNQSSKLSQLENIYYIMKNNNLDKINKDGFQYDNQLLQKKDDRYCQAIFSIIPKQNSHFTKEFDTLFELLSGENVGIVYKVNNDNYKSAGTFHFTFLQQLSFANFEELPENILAKHYDILKSILKLPFKIMYNKVIAVPSGLVLCGEADIDINKMRNDYRQKCKENNLVIIEPYLNNIVHSTLFRFVNKVNTTEFLKKYEYYLGKDIDYGYVIIDHFHIGKGTWKLNPNEIVINYSIRNYSIRNYSIRNYSIRNDLICDG